MDDTWINLLLDSHVAALVAGATKPWFALQHQRPIDAIWIIPAWITFVRIAITRLLVILIQNNWAVTKRPVHFDRLERRWLFDLVSRSCNNFHLFHFLLCRLLWQLVKSLGSLGNAFLKSNIKLRTWGIRSPWNLFRISSLEWEATALANPGKLVSAEKQNWKLSSVMRELLNVFRDFDCKRSKTILCNNLRSQIKIKLYYLKL